MKITFRLPFVLLLSLSILLFTQCKKDDDSGTIVMPTTITVTQSSNGPFMTGETVTLVAELRTDPTVGISSFKITRLGATLEDKNDFTSSSANITYDYTVQDDDFYEAPVSINFEMIDGNNAMKSAAVPIEVSVEFPFFVENFNPDSLWNLVLNGPVSTMDSAHILIEFPPFQPATFTGLDGTVFYNAPASNDLEYFNLNMTQAQVANAVSGLQSFDVGTFQGNLPIVIDIRGTGEYAVLNFSNIGGSMWGYRKRSESAGE